MRPGLLSRTVTAAAAGALLWGACGGGEAPPPAGQRLDVDEVERSLEQSQRERLPDLRIGVASCPPEVVARQGERFQCTLPIEDVPFDFVVRVGEVVAGRARYEFRPTRAIVELSRVAAFVRSQLDPSWRTATVDCGPLRVRALDVGGLLECQVTKGSSSLLVEAVVEDVDGTFLVREVSGPR